MTTATTKREKYFVLFDGTCNLCNNAVNFIMRYDSRELFCFIPIDSEKGTEYISRFKNTGAYKGSVLLIQDENIYVKSDAVLRILKYLDGLWPVLYIFIIVPRFIRDPVYNIIAKYRYRWFGTCTDCPEYRECLP